jgi:hypothetical protein
VRLGRGTLTQMGFGAHALHPTWCWGKFLNPSGSGGVDTHLLFISSLFFVLDDPVNFGKEGIILPHPYILSGMNPSPFLTD